METGDTLMIQEKIQTYHRNMTGEHHRYRSWEHCYSYFRSIGPEGLHRDRDHDALQMAFYLASWGMYRGSSFLLQYAYTVHLGVIDLLGQPRFSQLWTTEFGSGQRDPELISPILELIGGIRSAYQPFAPVTDSSQPTDTLITKVILGTLGCLPACDRYFIDGFKSEGFSYSYLNRNFIERALTFCQENLDSLREEQTRIERINGMYYPLMKLIDMYFWQQGFDRANKGKSEDGEQAERI